MQGPILESREVLMNTGCTAQQLETALRISAAILALGAQYSDLLNLMVFPQPQPGYDRKALLRHRKVLIDDEAYNVLTVVWKESPFVTDDALRTINAGRQFSNGSLNAWNLATKIAVTTDAVARTNSRIRAIALAAAAFGLIERDDDRVTKKPLLATPRLHTFMLTLSDNQFRILTELIPLLALTNLDLNTLTKQ